VTYSFLRKIAVVYIVSLLILSGFVPFAYANPSEHIGIIVRVVRCDDKPVENCRVQITALLDGEKNVESEPNAQKSTDKNGIAIFLLKEPKFQGTIEPSWFEYRVLCNCETEYGGIEKVQMSANPGALLKSVFGAGDVFSLILEILKAIGGIKFIGGGAFVSTELIAMIGAVQLKIPCDGECPPQPDEKSGKTIKGPTTMRVNEAKIECEYKWIDEWWPWDNNWEFSYTVTNLVDKNISDFKICFIKDYAKAKNLIEKVISLPEGWKWKFDGKCIVFWTDDPSKEIKPGEKGVFKLWFEELARGIVYARASRRDESGEHVDDPEPIPTEGVVACAVSSTIDLYTGGILDDMEGTTVVIPEEALVGTETLGIYPQENVLLSNYVPSGIQIIKAKEFTPLWLSFNKPVTINISYSDSEAQYIPESTFKAYWLNPDTLRWMPLSGSTVNILNNTVTFQSYRFGFFGIGGSSRAVGGYSISFDSPFLLSYYVGMALTIIISTVAKDIYVRRVRRREERH